MILLREIREGDLDALEQLAQIPGFINLTNDRDILREKISKAIQSFSDQAKQPFDGKYIFVAEDLETKKIVATSMIAGQHGTVESPHFYFEVGSEEKYSSTISTGFIHGTLRLKYDTNGPSEIGGLVLDPRSRNTEARIGRQISFVRFLYLGLNRAKFKRKILAELLPPLNKQGQSPLWEAIGRRFTNMEYWEADRLCQKDKEFIFSLFPTGKIYTTFLPAEARNAIGKVGKETEPVLHMLTKIGFNYEKQVDPFDGGPHLWAKVDEIAPIKKLIQGAFEPSSKGPLPPPSNSGLLCRAKQERGHFRAVAVQVSHQDGVIRVALPESGWVQSVLDVKSGDAVTFMPYY